MNERLIALYDRCVRHTFGVVLRGHPRRRIRSTLQCDSDLEDVINTMLTCMKLA